MLTISCTNNASELTLSAPVLATNSAYNIAQSAAMSGGNVLSDGGATVTQRGVCLEY